MIVSASSASRSDLATTVGPIARACGANASGGRRLATVTFDVLTGKGVGECLAYLAESYNCVAHMFSFGLPSPTALRIIEWSAVGRSASDLRQAAVDGDLAGGHEAAVRRREKGSRRPDLRRIGHALERSHRGVGLQALLA